MRVGAFLRQKTAVAAVLLFVVFFALAATQSFGAEAPTHGILPGFQEDESRVGQTKIQTDIAELPLSFISNAGQADGNVRFMVKAGTHTVFFTPQEIVFAANGKTDDDLTHSSVVRLRFAGANGKVRVEGEKLLFGVANYFLGNDPEQWWANVPTYAAITYHDLYPGIDLIYSGNQGRLKSEFVVAPGADPTLIIMAYSGTSSMHVREDGALVLETPIGELVEAPPLIYQVIDGESATVDGGYCLLGNGEVTFTLGDYVTTEPLIIDPSIEYSSYLGSSACDDAQSIAVDSSGNCYVSGATYGTNFPTKDPLQPSSGGGPIDGYVAKFDSTGDLVWATYLGGNGTDQLGAIALDSSNNVYVAGYSTATDFPTVNALQGSHAGGDGDAVVAKISADGSSLIYSTYFGGSGNDGAGGGIAVDVFGNAYVVGSTQSTDLPTVNAMQPTFSGGHRDNFVIKLDSTGSALIYATYLGGSGDELSYDVLGTCSGRATIAVDSSGNAYIEGYTTSSDFPTRNPIQGSNAGGMDAYLTKLSSTGSLVYSTYLGGSSCDAGLGVAVDQFGCAYVLGCTTSPDFPLENALQASNAGGYDLFVTKVSAAGTGIVYSTYLGGSGNESNDGGVFRGEGAISVDESGCAHLAGLTTSSNFPTVDAVQATSGGSNDVFVAKLAPSGNSLLFSSYLGGSSTDNCRSIAVDWLGNVYICGFTQSRDFPCQGAFQSSYAGGYSDAFFAKIGGFPAAPPSHTVSTPSTPTGPSSGQVGVSLDFSAGGSTCSQGYPVEYRFLWHDTYYSTWNSSGSASYAFISPGTYQVKAQARCSTNTSIISGWSAPLTVTISTAPPTHTVSTPNTPTGPDSGYIEDELTFSTGGATCSQGHSVQYQFDWGDGSTLNWTSASSDSHSYASVGTYQLKVQARCSSDIAVTSSWSPAKTVVISGTSTPSAVPPVLLVHGFQRKGGYLPLQLWAAMGETLSGTSTGNATWVTTLDSDHSFWRLENRNESSAVVYISNYGKDSALATYSDIRLYANRLQKEIQTIKEREGVEEIDIVAHSMGGLVARAYIEHDDFPTNPYGTSYEHDVRKIVMLGTPNHGVPAAVLLHLLGALAISELAVEQMEPNSSFLNILNHGCGDCLVGDDQISQDVRYDVVAGNFFECHDSFFDFWSNWSCISALYGENDGLVSTASAQMDGAGLHIRYVNHSGLREVKEIRALVSSILKEEHISRDQPHSVAYFCPVHIVITDEYGRSTSDTGANEIPDAVISFDELNEAYIFYLPLGLTYSITISAYESGVFTMIETLPTVQEGIMRNVFSDVAITGATVATVEISPGDLSRVMQVDADGDGQVDEEIEAIGIGNEEEPIPDEHVAVIHGPNPVSSDGCIFWLDLPENVAQAKLMLFSITGRLVFETPIAAGATRFPDAGTWAPVDQDGIPLANGPYVYVLIADGKVIGQGKMVIQR